MAIYTWRKDPDNPIKIDPKGLLTITVEELADGERQSPKRIFSASVPENFGTPAERWAELRKLLKIEIEPYSNHPAAETQAQKEITDDMLTDFEYYLMEAE